MNCVTLSIIVYPSRHCGVATIKLHIHSYTHTYIHRHSPWIVWLHPSRWIHAGSRSVTHIHGLRWRAQRAHLPQASYQKRAQWVRENTGPGVHSAGRGALWKFNEISKYLKISKYLSVFHPAVRSEICAGAREVKGGWGRDPFSRNFMKPTPRRKWYLTTGRRFH